MKGSDRHKVHGALFGTQRFFFEKQGTRLNVLLDERSFLNVKVDYWEAWETRFIKEGKFTYLQTMVQYFRWPMRV